MGKRLEWLNSPPQIYIEYTILPLGIYFPLFGMIKKQWKNIQAHRIGKTHKERGEGEETSSIFQSMHDWFRTSNLVIMKTKFSLGSGLVKIFFNWLDEVTNSITQSPFSAWSIMKWFSNP